MTRFFFNSTRLFALSAAVLSSIGVLSAMEANALTFKATLSDSPFHPFGPQDIEYTLADGIFDTIISSPINTFFSDPFPAPSASPRQTTTVVPEVVTEFKWAMGEILEPMAFEQSIFGITDRGLFLQLLNPSEGQHENILMATIQAPEGLSLSACKTQVCEGVATLGGPGGFAGLRMIQTPVHEEPKPVPEPSAAVALGFVGALALKRQRKTTGKAQPVTTAD
jgi:hypothetical protein